MGGWRGIVNSSAVVAILLSMIWNAANVEGCFSGRYGRYENWPSVHDWEELLLLLTGKYWDNGAGGWGWSSPNGYSYNSIGGGHSSSFGSGGGLGSFSSGYKGGSGGSTGGSHFSSPASQSGGFGGGHGDLSSTVDTEKMKQALSAFFNKNKHKPESSTSFGSGGGIGQSFIDTPGYGAGPSHPKKPAHFEDPPLSFGPPYDDSPKPPSVSGWPGSSPSKPGFEDNGLDHGPPQSFNNGPPLDQGQPFDHDPTKDGSPYHNPSPYDTGPSHDFGPPYGPSNDHGPHYDQGPSQDFGPPKDHGPSFDHPGPFIDDSSYNRDRGPPRENHYSRPEPPNNKFNNNQFQSDYDTFGGFDDKRRRQGRRRWFDGKAGLPTKPNVPALKALRQKLPPPPPRRRMQRNQRLHERHQRMSRRKINTSFGGYKVDHSRLRYG